MGTVANTQETIIGISYKKQSAIGTGVTSAADFWRIAKTNPSLASIDLKTESDAADIGKGDEFAQNVFLLSKDIAVPIEGYLTSAKLAWALAFALGKTTKTAPAAGAYLYTSVMSSPVTDGIEPPLFTYVEQIRPGGSSVIDQAINDCCVNSMSVKMNSGAGRQNATISVEAVGSGLTTQPSAITLPASLVEAGLNSGGFGIVINGTNYITARSFVDCEFGISKAIDLEGGLYPGSGTQGGFQIRGRMEHGVRAVTLRFKARFTNGSTELASLLAQTDGTAVLTWQGALITGSTYHGGTITLHKSRISAAKVQDSGGKVVVECTVTAITHPSNGLVTAVIVTDQNNILTSA